MSQLTNLYNILKKDEKEKDDNFTFKPIRPSKEVQFEPFNIPQSRKKSVTKENLAKVLAFIDLNKNRRFSNGLTVMPIPCTAKDYISICGNSRGVSRLINFMKDMGLIADYESSYQYNAFYSKDNKSKTYAYRYEAEEIIKAYCITNDINKFQIKNYINTVVDRFKSIQSFETSEVKFTSKGQFLKPDDYSAKELETYLLDCLKNNYEDFSYYQKLSDEINETYYKDEPDLRIRFLPTFTWNKGNTAIRKIGIRATNALVSAKKEADEDKLTRQEVLDRYNLKTEVDVTSSVPRITFLLNNGYWLDESIDLYEEIYKVFVKKCPEEKIEWNNETRKMFKSFFMRAYFDSYTAIAGHIKREISKRIKYNPDDWIGLDYIMKSYKESVEEVLGGKLYDSEIFYYESVIYMSVLKELLDNGFNVWQCYDAFYLDTDNEIIQVQTNKLIRNKAEAYYKQITNNKYNSRQIRIG